MASRSVMASTASGEPSASCSTSWAASAGTAVAATSRVTGTGQGVPSASVPRTATVAVSASSMKPRSGANAPDVISSRSPSWASSSGQDGQPDSSAGKSRSADGAGEESR